MDDAVLGRRGEPRPPVADVVGVRARQDRCVAAARASAAEPVVELGLAVVAAIAVVRAVALARELVGGDRLVARSRRPRRRRVRRRARRSRARARPRSPRAPARRAHAPRARRRATSRRRRRTRRRRCRARAIRARARRSPASCSCAPRRAPRPTPTLPARPGRLGKRGTVVVLGRDVDDAPVEQPDLHSDGAAVELDVTLLTLELVPPQPRRRAARARSSPRGSRGPSRLSRGPGERREHEARPALFHLRGHRPDVERAGGEAALDRVGDELRLEVVEVGLEHDHLAPRRLARRPEYDADDVRTIGEVPRARAVADALERERRQRPPRVGDGRGDAAPVGVTISTRSRRRPAARPRAAPASPAPAAAAPRARRDEPRANGSAEQRRGRSRARRGAHAPQMSTSVSTEPSSWKWTSSVATPCTPRLGLGEATEPASDRSLHARAAARSSCARMAQDRL